MADNDAKEPTDEPAVEPATSLESTSDEGASSAAGAAISLDELVQETAAQAAAHAEFISNEAIGGSGLAAGVGASKSESVAGAPVPGDESKTKSGAAPAPAAPDFSLERVDDVLGVEDPNFVQGLDEIKKIGAESPDAVGADFAASELEPLHGEEVLEPPDPHSLRHLWNERKNGKKAFLKALVQITVHHGKGAAFSLKSILKDWIGRLLHLPLFSKLMLVSALVLLTVLGWFARLTFFAPPEHELRLPKIEASFLGEFEPIADHAWEYADDAAMVNFQDPMLHPENVILFEHVIVNLKPSSAHQNPMALAEFYVEAGSKDAAIEIKQREVEVRDSMSRTLEQMPYEDISTDDGKRKLKVILRKNLNEFITTGRIRRLYFKSLVLKP